MSFEDLPPNWTELPLSTPNLAGDVVDLVLSEWLRAANALLLLPCNDQDIPLPSPVVLEDTDWFVEEAERQHMMQALAGVGVPSAVLAVSSAQRLPAEVVAGWHRDAQAAFTAAESRLLGFYSAWPNHVNQASLPVH